MTQTTVNKSQMRFYRYVQFVVLYIIAVILWGAFVRATGSGAGCGEHWPTCNGQVFPTPESTKMMIEFSHRLTSGLALIFVAALVWFARRIFPKGHEVRRGAWWSFVFIIGEAAVGAMLVLLALVAHNDSVARAIVIAFHLVNTFLLLYWLAFTVHSSRRTDGAVLNAPAWKWRGVRLNLFFCLALYCTIGAAGAIVALGDTLFPSASLAEGIAADFSDTAHFLIRLRFLHPVLAVLFSIYISIQMLVMPKLFSGLMSRPRASMVVFLLLVQLLVGVSNMLLLAPVWMQMLHLLMADVVWLALVGVYVDARQRAAVLEIATP